MQQVALLLDHLVGADEQRRRQLETERTEYAVKRACASSRVGSAGEMWCCQMVPKSIYVDRHIAVLRLGWAG